MRKLLAQPICKLINVMQLAKNSLLQRGKYKIVGTLGHGGFGITYLGLHVALNRKVAIKEFFMKEYCERDKETSQVSLGTCGSRELVERFRYKFIKEAQTIAALDHPYIIRIYDVFEENGTAYYVMEYHGNGSLADYIKWCEKIDEAEALQYIRQIADALGYIHERKMNHLDVKPGNVLLSDKGKAVLIDFGMSKRYDEEGKETSTTPVGISHGYAPLEQYNRGGIGTFSPATDIYSLGATLYKLLTGQTPPDANVVMDDGLPPFPNGVSRNVVEAVKQAMQPFRKKRPRNVTEFLHLLEGKDDVKDLEETVIEDTLSVTNASNSTELKQEKDKQTETAQYATKKLFLKKWMLLLLFVLGIIVFVCVFNIGNSSHTITPEIDSLNQDILEEIKIEQNVDSFIVESEHINYTQPSLYITTSPNGAVVYVDGKRLGITPIVDEKIDSGIHSIEITKKGYETIVKKRKAYSNEHITLNFSLEKTKTETDKIPIANQSNQKVSNTFKGHEYVDLGLSVMWATCNIGASKPSDYGNYFAWAETNPYSSDYNYEGSKAYGNNILNITGSKNYDAATAIWGTGWRIPTKAEFKELINKCKWVWTSQNGQKGYEIIGPNQKTIFLPAAGLCMGSSYINGNEKGTYWSATADPNDNERAYALNFKENDVMKSEGYEWRGYWGYSIRPVVNKKSVMLETYDQLVSQESEKEKPTFGLR